MALRDASFLEMEKSMEIDRRAKHSQRDAKRMRIDEAIEKSHDRGPRCDARRDRVPQHDPDPDTKSEIDLTRHRNFMHDEGPPPKMRHLEEVDLDVDDRVFALLDDGRNRTCHTSRRAYKARYGFNNVNRELGELTTTSTNPKY